MTRDNECLKEILHGSTAAYSKLISEYIPIVSRTSYRIMCDRSDSEKITKEVMLTLWHDPKSYLSDKPLSHQLLKKTCHLCRKYLFIRRFKAIFSVQPDVYVVSTPVVPSYDEFVSRQAWEVFCRASLNCTDRQRIVYALCELEQIPSSEVSEIISFFNYSLEDALNTMKEMVKVELDQYGRIDDYEAYVGFVRKIKDQLTDSSRIQSDIMQEIFS